jgi:hypothetical protein
MDDGSPIRGGSVPAVFFRKQAETLLEWLKSPQPRIASSSVRISRPSNLDGLSGCRYAESLGDGEIRGLSQ